MELSKILNFFGTQRDYIEKRDIVSSLISTRNNIKDFSIPAVESCISEGSYFDKNADEYKNALSSVRRRYAKNTVKLELFESFKVILTDSETILNKLIELSDTYFTETIDKDSITYPRMQIMAISQSIDFIGSFIPKYCRYVISVENLSPGQVKYIKNNLVKFYDQLGALTLVNVKDIAQQLKNIPNVVVSEDKKERTMFNPFKLDPTGMTKGFLSAATNPFYYIRMAIVDYQHSCYNLAKEEAETIKIELAAMKVKADTGSSDAYIEKQLEKAQERLNKLEYKIHTYEAKAMDTKY